MRKILLHFVFRERITLLAQALGGEGRIPRLQFRHAEFGRGERAQLHPIALGVRTRAHGQVLEERDHLCRRFRHLRRQRYFSEVLITERVRFFGAQLQLLDNIRRVVPFRLAPAVVRTQLGCSRHVRAIHRFTQRPMFGVLHHRKIRGEMQRELPAFAAFFLRGFACRFNHVFRQPCKLTFLRDDVRKRVGGIEDVIGECLR